MTTYDIGGVRVDRRALIRLLGITAVGAVPAAGLLSGCALGGGDPAGGNAGGGVKDAKNPLGINEGAPLEFFNFEGGYGKDWPQIDATLYRGRYPKAKVTITGAQQMKQQLQPRFVGGNPPDVTATNDLNLPALVQQGQLTPLEPLLAAPSFDTPGKTVEQSLLPGVLSFGKFDGKVYAHPYVDGIAGIWYSKPLMDSHGWTYPKTWDEMMALCVKIKAAGLAPWTYQGKYPGYLVNPMLNTALKAAGLELGRSIDNLEQNAWRNPAILATATRYHELAAKGFLLEGTTGLTHTQAQTYWAQRKVVFIPCGSWLENELGPIAPKDLGMSVDSPPSLSANEKLPFAAIQVNIGGDFAVPAHAKNPLGGMEFLRMMLSKQSAADFTKRTNELTVVDGYADTLQLSSALTSRRDAIKRAGNNLIALPQYQTWYPPMSKGIEDATAALMGLEISPADWVSRCQKAADTTAKDTTIHKFHR